MMERHMRRAAVAAGLLLLVVALFLIGACESVRPYRPPNVTIQGAQTGGAVLAFNPSSTVLVSGDLQGKLCMWALPAGERIRCWIAHDGNLYGAAFVNGGRNIVTGGYDRLLSEWALDGKRLHRKLLPSPVTAMAVDGKASVIITGHADGVVRVWRLADFSPLREYPLHTGSVRALAVDPSQGLRASSGAGGRVFFWDDRNQPKQLTSPPTDASSLAFAPDGKQLYGGGWFKLFRWQLGTDTMQVLDTDHHGIIKSLQFTPDGKRLASISRQTDSSVYFLDPKTGAVVQRFQPHDLCGSYVAVSPNGRYLATTSDDATVRIWDLRNPRSEH